MSYPNIQQILNTKPPQINLPHPKCTKNIIYTFFDIFGNEGHRRKVAKCKTCKDKVELIIGNNVYSSYTFGLTCHLRKHPSEWQVYLDMLGKTIIPDIKTQYEHYQSMTRQKANTDKEESTRNFYECAINFDINRKNCAGIYYIPRDCEVLRGNLKKNSENGKILSYLYPYTNRNVHIFELIGRRHHSAPLRGTYKQSKCLVENEGDITIDLERLFCENICFFDPELYDSCPCKHEGDIKIFGKEEYQKKFDGFSEEIEKYPEFQWKKSFDSDILKNVKIVELDEPAVLEMNRLLKIILSLLIIQKPHIQQKISEMVDSCTSNDNLRKPDLGVQLWGPKFENIDTEQVEDESILYNESLFFTFQHNKSEDCPAYGDPLKQIHKKAVFFEGKASYPCNVGGCSKGCLCIPCNKTDRYQEVNSFRCPHHNPDHPDMFDEEEDLALVRRRYIEVSSKKPIYERPTNHRKLCPPKIKFAGMKKKCKACMEIFNDHRKNHHVLHPVCQLCNHMDHASKVSFALICYVCLKTFKNKYRLADHMNIHSDTNPFYCEACEVGFTRRCTLERHIKEYHRESTEAFKCSQCNTHFSSDDNLRRHVKTKHLENAEDFACNLCDRKFKRHDTLLKHEEIGHNLRSNVAILPGINDEKQIFQCDICQKVYNQKFTLRRHIESKHAKQNVYQCNICGKGFDRKDVLQVHAQIHNRPVNRIVCEVCLMEFPSKQLLREHRLETHDNVK